MSSKERESNFSNFLSYVKEHISGDEKGEGQLFLDHLFQAFGWPGLKQAGATCEVRLKNDNGGISFADLVWKPIVLIEMKKRGANLARHYRQAFDYWTRLVPGRPRYAVLCNFDEFWIYDFETQMDTPVHQLKLLDLPRNYGPLAFMFPTPEPPVFGNHQEKVTREAANNLATCFNSLVHRGVDRPLAQRFILQTLVALFSEDIGLLEKYFFTRLLDECTGPKAAFDLIGGLFTAMNTPEGVAGGRFRGIAFFNGGLFAKPAAIELKVSEIELLRTAAKSDWSKVRPEIFGVLFETSLDKEERHAFGAHYTNAADIMKIVGPTIVEPWREQIESAKTLKALKGLLRQIELFKVLDPACGSGNFLYLAYRELKRLEARIYERMADEYKTVSAAQRTLGFVTAKNFFGIDINPFAIDIAKVTMVLAHKLAIDELQINENALPLDNLDQNFITSDSLIQDDGSRTPWPRVDVIIGNPPFLGAKRVKPERGADYVKTIRRAYPEVPGMADYCVYWIRRANDEIPLCTEDNPCTGRVGLVGTQNIRNNQSRVGGLDQVTHTGSILDAVQNQPWSGDANVNVSIVNWAKTKDPSILPKQRRLWSKVNSKTPQSVVGPKKSRADKQYELEFRLCKYISSSLSDGIDVSGARTLACNTDPQKVFQGITPGHDGFVLTIKERDAALMKDPICEEVIFPYFIGRELVNGDGRPKRSVIDFGERTLIEASAYSWAISRVQETVLKSRMEKAEKGKDSEGNMRSHHKQFLERWWRLSWDRAEMKEAFKHLKSRYIVGSRTQRWPFIFCFLSTAVLPGDKLQVFAFDDDYSFGVLQSGAHLEWYKKKAARLKNEVDYNYSSESVFNTFPWPQAPSYAKVEAVADCARKIRRIRQSALARSRKGGLRALYKLMELPGKNELKDAHAELDAAVETAYGFSETKECAEQLLELNLNIFERLKHGLQVTSPGIPSAYKDKTEKLISRDCVCATVEATAVV